MAKTELDIKKVLSQLGIKVDANMIIKQKR
jgi:hypothetical protein